MELLWKEESIDALSGRLCEKIEVEGAIPLPEGKKCGSILASLCRLESFACTCRDEGVCIEGTVLVSLVCEEDGDIYAFDSRASFSHRHDEGASHARCCCVLSDPSVKLLNGTPQFSCVIEADLILLRHESLRLLSGIDGLPENDLQCRETSLQSSYRVSGETIKLRLREEIALPNISELLSASGELQLREEGTGEGELSGTLSLALLCRDSDGRIFESLEHVPFRSESGLISAGMETGECSLTELSVRSVGEEFGILVAEAQLSVEQYRLESRSCTLPLDAYSPSLPFICGFSELEAFSDAGCRRFRSSFEQTMSVPEGLPEIAAPIYSCAQPCVTSSAVENGRLYVEGILETRLVYRNASGSIYAFSDEIPFTADAPAPDCNITQLSLQALSCLSGTGRTLQAQFCLCFSACFYKTEKLRAVSSISECEKTPRSSGIVILFSGAGETLFDIAKRYNSTVDSIRALQPDISEPLEEGSRILMLV